MMFLVIFGSLAAAMAIVAQGNLATADAHLKINRSLSAAETGMGFVIHRLALASNDTKTRAGLIDASVATTLWNDVRAKLLDPSYAHSLVGAPHNLAEPTQSGSTLSIGPIAVGPSAPTFTAVITPHPITGENYNSSYYQRPPYSTLTPAVSAAYPLDATWIRVTVTGYDSTAVNPITRTLRMDFRIDKKIKYAILSKSRVMIGRNVMIEGPIGSRFMETHLENGHPILMQSDFQGLHADLDDNLAALVGTLATNDANGDNRINLSNPNEITGLADPAALDTNADGYIDDYDFFLAQFDANADRVITALELDTANHPVRAQLFELIDTFGAATRAGYNDGQISFYDYYTKLRGKIQIRADLAGWEAGAAHGPYQDYLQGSIRPFGSDPPMTFDATELDNHEFVPADFDMTSFRNIADGDLATQASAQAVNHDPDDPNSPGPLGQTQFESVPYGSAYPYDYYDRPVYRNMTFTNVKIPKGTNALFVNCKFIGCTFIESEADNGDPNYNYAGRLEQDGTPRFFWNSLTATVNGVQVNDTKPFSNNVRFDSCTFEGAVVTDSTPNYTHVRNKITFTGATQWKIDDSTNLTLAQKQLYKRSTILAPHYSVEMGTFIDPQNPQERVQLSGTIVAGVLDMRGQVKINGTILTTFEPVSDTGPVLGETSPQFNTTLGYFPSTSGDLEAEIPAVGLGVIQVRYDPTLPLPDGILGPIQIEPNLATYFEGRP